MPNFALALVLAGLSFNCLFADQDPLSNLLIRYKAEPQNANLCEQIGVAYTRMSNFDGAITFFKKALQLNPQALSAQKNLATVLWFSGRKNESENIFRKLEERIPKDPVPQLYLGLAAYEKRSFPEAAHYFEQAGTLASDNPELLSPVIETYLGTGRFESAVSILNKWIASGAVDSQVYRWLGDAYDGEKIPDKAYRAYSAAIEQEPEKEENYLALASFSIDHANLPFAREVLNRGLAVKPHSAKLLFDLGLVWASEGNADRSREAFLKAQTADPQSSLPLLALGIADLQAGQAENAAKYFEEAGRIAPQDYRPHYLRALALMRIGSVEVKEELRRALQLDSRQAHIRVALADLENKEGNSKAAEGHLRAALKLDPNEPTALYQLSLLCRRQGKNTEAEQLMRLFQKAKKRSQSGENDLILILKTAKADWNTMQSKR